MFINVRKISILVVALAAIVTILAALLLLKPENGPVLAQGGGESDKSNLMEAVQGSDLGQAAVVSEGGDIGSQSDGSGVEVVPIGAFRHIGNNANGYGHNLASGYIYNKSASLMCFSAPTYPPEGATITELHWTFVDDNAANDLAMYLFRVQNTNSVVSGADQMAGAAFSPWDDPGVLEVFYGTISNPVVSHDYSYYIYFCFPASTGLEMRLYGVRVFYTP